MHGKLPNDISLIIHRYIHREKYAKCKREYANLYIPHWKDDDHIFSWCHDKRNLGHICPILHKHGILDRCCPKANFRYLDNDIYSNGIYSIMFLKGAGCFALVPKHY